MSDDYDKPAQQPVRAGQSVGWQRLGRPPYTRLEKALAAMAIVLGVLVLTVFCTLRLWVRPYHVVYRVEGTAPSVLISVKSNQSGMKTMTVEVPWEQSFYAGRQRQLLLSARSTTRKDRATCEIWVDGLRWRSETSRGSEGSAGCSGVLGEE